MHVQTVRELGALVRSARRSRGLTQAELAERLRVSRDWVVRLEQGSPRLEVQKVLDALSVLGLMLEVADTQPTGSLGSTPSSTKVRARSATTGRYVPKSSAAKRSPTVTGKTHKLDPVSDADPFSFLKDRTA